eukprot:GHRQ01040111.1.p1 GENE.GHRQ01040111.1~~GHRQ01040111.1.p1  ORF type:complete len:195 (+),score=80.99 GHRQ01040111.1:126-710(+)
MYFCVPALLLVLYSSISHANAAQFGANKRVEVYGFAVASSPTYRGYNWSLLTTSAWRTDAALVELAAQHGAKVELNAGVTAATAQDIMGSPEKRSEWVSQQVVQLVKLGARGINFDLEVPMQAGDSAAAAYAALVNLTAQTLHGAVPGATVSVDVPWSPFDVDSRNYDWLQLAAAADTLFVMAYDTASQVSRVW